MWWITEAVMAMPARCGFNPRPVLRASLVRDFFRTATSHYSRRLASSGTARPESFSPRTRRPYRPEALAPLVAFETVALWQAFAPSALVASLAEDELVNEHGDEIITVLVMPLAAIPAAMADALRKQPIAGPIPTSVPDETRHHRSLKQIRQDFVVQVTGDFTKEEILRFTERVDLDVDNVNLLLGRNKPGDSR